MELIREKSGVRILLLTAVVAAVVSCVIFGMMYRRSELNEIDMLDHYINSIDSIVEVCSDVLEERKQDYTDDFLVRADLGLQIYKDGEEEAPAVRLETVKNVLAADDVLLADKNGKIIESTGGEIESLLTADVWADMSASETQYTEKKWEDGDEHKDSLIVMRRLSDDDDTSLVMTFDYTPFAEALDEYGGWDVVLERLLLGLDAYAFVQWDESENVGDEVFGYPMLGFTDKETAEIKEKVKQIFKGMDSFGTARKSGDDKVRFGTENILDKHCLVALIPCSSQNVNVLIAVPTKTFISSAMHCAFALSLFVTLNLFLLAYYIIRRRELDSGEKKRFSAAPGLLFVLASTLIFFTMMLRLDTASTIASTTIAQRTSLEYEIMFNENEAAEIKAEYPKKFITWNNAVARLLSNRPEYRTEENLRKLSRITGAEYLMLYDRKGREILSSNQYTGFEVSSNESDASYVYRKVMMGYPYVITAAAEDPLSGKTTGTVASLVTDENGKPDGFVVMAADAEDFVRDMESLGPEKTVNGYVAQDDIIAAMADTQNGIFIANSDEDLIGKSTSKVLDEDVLDCNYEGFTQYDGRTVYLSCDTDGTTDTMIISDRRWSRRNAQMAIIMIAFVLAVTSLVFYPLVKKMAAACSGGLDARLPEEVRMYPMQIFLYGYVIFFTLFAAFATIADSRGMWPVFGFVFDREWSRGIHLFSLWMALFLVAVTMSGVFIIRAMLSFIDDRLSQHARTLERLADSLVTYAAVIILVGYIMYMFGVDTAALLASAGIVSIAVGMGARDIISDIFAGLFMIFEGSVRVGDIVQIGDWKGRVTDMGIRTTEVTDERQNVKIFSNSRILEVINMSRNKTVCTLDFRLPRSMDVDQVPVRTREVTEAVSENIEELKDNLHMLGIVEITPREYTVRLEFACIESECESVTRRLRTAVELELNKDTPGSGDEITE